MRKLAFLSRLRDPFKSHPIMRASYPATMGLAVFLAYPSLVGQQDFASLLPKPVAEAWLAHLPEIPGATAINAYMKADLKPGATDAGPTETDPIVTASVASMAAPGRMPRLANSVSTEPKLEREPQRINRALKGNRVVSATTKAPPAHFSAGSVLQRQSMFEPLEAGDRTELAFVQRRPYGEAIEVASLFHAPRGAFEVNEDLPVMVASLVHESKGNVLAYFDDSRPERSPFAAVLDDGNPFDLIPKLDKGDHSWADDPLPISVYAKEEQRCLTAGIYFEARGEPVRGQAAVSQVILNRVRNPAYPNTACGVVYQNKRWRNRCQFSFACDRIADRVRDPERWEIAEFVARETTEGRIWLKEVGSSTHYHATYVNPKWAHRMKRVGRIGLHIFYRTRGGGWS